MTAQKAAAAKPRKKSAGKKRLRIKLVKSPIGYSERQKGTVRALGLRRMNRAVEQDDTAVVRGMIAKVSHLVTVEEIK